MNGSLRDHAMLASLGPRGMAALELAPAEALPAVARPAQRFVQPARFNWARYEHVKRQVHAKVCVISMLLTGLVMALLWWKAAQGGIISPERWLCGAASGWLIARMFRLGLFVILSAPRCLTFEHDRCHLSGMGVLKPGDVSGWSLTRETPPGARSCRCLRLEIRCRWFGCARGWTMFVVDGPEVTRLRRLLEVHVGPPDQVVPKAGAAAAPVLMQTAPMASAHEPLSRTTPVRPLAAPVWRGGEPILDEVA